MFTLNRLVATSAFAIAINYQRENDFKTLVDTFHLHYPLVIKIKNV
jgi:hypothetical protein